MYICEKQEIMYRKIVYVNVKTTDAENSQSNFLSVFSLNLTICCYLRYVREGEHPIKFKLISETIFAPRISSVNFCHGN